MAKTALECANLRFLDRKASGSYILRPHLFSRSISPLLPQKEWRNDLPSITCYENQHCLPTHAITEKVSKMQALSSNLTGEIVAADPGA